MSTEKGFALIWLVVLWFLLGFTALFSEGKIQELVLGFFALYCVGLTIAAVCILMEPD